jgi:hypothetical protein
MEVSGQFHSRGEGRTRYPSHRATGRPQSRSERYREERELSCHYRQWNAGCPTSSPVAKPTELPEYIWFISFVILVVATGLETRILRILTWCANHYTNGVMSDSLWNTEKKKSYVGLVRNLRHGLLSLLQEDRLELRCFLVWLRVQALLKS